MIHASTARLIVGLMTAAALTSCGSQEQAPKAGTPKHANLQRNSDETKASSDKTNAPTTKDEPVAATDDETTPDQADSDEATKDETAKDDAADTADTKGGDSTKDTVDQANSKSSALTFTSEKRDDNDHFLAIRVNGGAWTQQPWPAKGQSVEFSGVCISNKTTTIEIKGLNQHNAETLIGPDLAVLSSTDNTARIGYEPTHCTGTGCQDDFLGTLSCSSGKLKI